MFRLPKLPIFQSPIFIKSLELFQRRPVVSYSVLGVILVSFVWYFSASGTTAKSDVLVSPTKGQFLVTVTTTGELQAKSSIDIKGSENARAAGIWQMKITNIIPEGTVVKKDAFVADMDKSEIMQKVKDSQLSVQKLKATYLQTKLLGLPPKVHVDAISGWRIWWYGNRSVAFNSVTNRVSHWDEILDH